MKNLATLFALLMFMFSCANLPVYPTVADNITQTNQHYSGNLDHLEEYYVLPDVSLTDVIYRPPTALDWAFQEALTEREQRVSFGLFGVVVLVINAIVLF